MRSGSSVLRALAIGIVSAALVQAQPHYSYIVQTVAGSYPLGDGGPATSALMEPLSVISSAGGVTYVGEESGRIRKVSASSTIETLTTLDSAVLALTRDAAGILYASTSKGVIYQIDAAGHATRIAGGGVSLSDGIPATKAFMFPVAIVVDSQGRLIYADWLLNMVRAVNKDGTVSTIAGTGEMDSSGDGKLATDAAVDTPSGLAIDAQGNLFVAEWAHIRKITPDGIITTVAGNGTWGYSGDLGSALTARICPDSLAIDGAGNLYFGQSYYDVVRKIKADGTISTVAGTGDTGFGGDGGPAVVALLDTPSFVWIDENGGLLISDYGNARIRRVSGSINTVAGSSHFRGDGGAALDAVFRSPDFAVQNAGNLSIADTMNRRIRAVGADGNVTTIAGNGAWSPKPEGVPATSSAVGNVLTMAVDPQGNLVYGGLGAVRQVDKKDGTVSTIAGSTTEYDDSGDGLLGTWARFYTPSGLAWDKDGNLYIADADANRIRKLAAADGKVSAYAGSGYADQTGDNGPALAADIANPTGLAFDSAGNLYVLSDHSQIRRIAPDGTISTPIISGVGDAIDTKPRAANTVEIGRINSVAVDSTDTLYFTIPGGIAAFKDGNVWRVAGSDTPGFTGDGKPALAAQFGVKLTVWAAPDRTLVVSDVSNQRVRLLTLANPRQIVITGGDGQSAQTGALLPQMFTVRVVGPGGLPAPLVPVTFAVASGAATVNPATVMTDADGTAQTSVTLGATAGTVKISATAGGLPAIEFTATATAPANGGDAPQISEGGITGAALSVPPVKTISPNAIVTVWGKNFIAAGTQRRLTPADLVQGRIPTVLDGLCVQFGTERAPIFDIYPGQLNVQVPAVTSGTVEVKVLRNCGQANEVASDPVRVVAANATPEFFAFSASADGHVPVAARHNPSNVIVGPKGAYGEPSLPAAPGLIVTVYGTGFGLTSPAYAPGELPGAAASPTVTPVVTLGGVTLAPEDVLYVGVTPGNAGLYQLNLRIPDTVPDGEQPLVLRLGDAATPDGPYLLIRR